jgi:hypothetical protein
LFNRYRRLAILNKAVDENGDINRAVFSNEVRRSYKGQWNRIPDGQDEFIDFARIFSTFKPLSSSGTAENLAAQEIMKKMGGGVTIPDVIRAGLLRGAQRGLKSKKFREFMLKQPTTRTLTPEALRRLRTSPTARGLGGAGTEDY